MALHYQPQYDLKTGELRGLEALIRWNDPERGLIYPGAFIPLAETSGLMPLIDRWVIDHVQKQRRIWREQSLCPGVIAINVSSHRFNTSDLEKQFEDLLAEQGRCQYQIEIEITETRCWKTEQASPSCAAHEKGIHLPDDFGSGIASLNYLAPALDLVNRSAIRAIDRDRPVRHPDRPNDHQPITSAGIQSDRRRNRNGRADASLAGA